MGDNAECVAEFVSKTAADSSVAQVLLKITENSVDDAVQLFHSISDEKSYTLPQPVTRIPHVTSTAGGSADTPLNGDERRLNRYHRGFSFCSPETLLTSLHEKIKNDFNHLVPPVDEVEEIVVPKDLFYLPNLLSLDAEILCFFFDDLVDIQTLERLEHFHHLNWWAVKEPKNRLYPIVTRGDGNCLLHAASLGIYGVHDKELTLRGSVHRLLPQLPSLRRRWQHEMELRFKEFGFDIELTDEQWSSEWEDILKMSSPAPLSKPPDSSTPPEESSDNDYYSMDSLNKVKYRSLEDFHVYVLANVLYRPIIVIAMSHLYSQDNQDLLAPVYFGGVYLPLERDPELSFKTPLILAYDSSHFCPLLPMEEGDAFVPLVDCMLAALPVRFAYDPDIDSPQPVEELLNKYLIVCKTTILTKQLEIRAEFTHVDITLPTHRPGYQTELLANYLTKAGQRYEQNSEYVDSKMYLIWKYLSVIPQYPKSERVFRLSSVTGTNEAVRKRLASEESAVSPAPPGSRSTTSTLKSTKSNQSSKSLKVLKKCFNVHRRFASASNIEKQRSQNTLDKKYSSVGASICSLKESPAALTEPPPSPPHHNLTYNLKHSIKRRFSTRDKKRERPDHGAAPVKVHPPKPPPQSCITACFGGQTGDVDNVKG